MRARVDYTVTITDTDRRAIRYAAGQKGLATRAEVAHWYQMHGRDGEPELRKLADRMLRESSQAYRLRPKTVLVPGRSVVKIRGERGATFVYQGWKSDAGGDVLTFVGGKSGHRLTRSFRPEQITTVRTPRKGTR